MMFKKRRVGRLRVELARVNAEIDVLARICVVGVEVSSYYADKLISKTGEMAAVQKRIDILEGRA